MSDSPVRNVSDTARWVASYRAQETERPDALFRDPLAARLAGDRGKAMAGIGNRQMRSGWFLVMRTKLLDEQIEAAIAAGADLIVNLAAGLDTRPYRMNLPPTLRWVEADLPAMVKEKNEALAGETPRCHLARVAADLSDAAVRRAFLQSVVVGSRHAVVITEGLLIYLDEPTVVELANDIRAVPAFKLWLMDLCSPKILELMGRTYGSALASAPMKFAPANGAAFFEQFGWRAASIRVLFYEAIKHRRVPLWMRIAGRIFPAPDPRKPRGPWSAVIGYERA